MAKKNNQNRPKPTSKHFSNDPLYQRVIYVTQYADTNTEAAKRLGISTSTLRRWKKYGIPDRSIDKYSKHITRVSAGIKGSWEKQPEIQRKEFRPLYYYRTFGGVRTKYWIVEGAPYDALLEIILRECYKGIYSGYSLLLETVAPFEGIWDGEGGMYSVDDINSAPIKQRKSIRDSGSWIQTSDADPFISTRTFPLIPGHCHPSEFEDTLFRFYGMKNIRIHEIRVKEFRQSDE